MHLFCKLPISPAVQGWPFREVIDYIYLSLILQTHPQLEVLGIPYVGSLDEAFFDAIFKAKKPCERLSFRWAPIYGM